MNSKIKYNFLLFFICISGFTLSLNSQELSAEKIYEIAEKSVVVVLAYDYSGNSYQGSGVVVSENGLVATNYHVCNDAQAIEVKHYDKIYRNIAVIAKDETKDILILKVDSYFSDFLHLSNTISLKQGQRIYAIGSPEGYENSISEGIISGFRTDVNNVRLIQMTAPITDGSSGGAVLNSQGKLIGLSVSGQHEGNIYFAIPADHIAEMIGNYTATISQTPTSDFKAEDFNYLEIGEEAYRNMNFTEAEINYSKHLEKFSNDMNVLYKRAYSRFRMKEYKSAINDFTKTIENGMNKSESFFYRGNCFFSLREYNHALSDYTIALEMEPDNAEIYYNRGYANFRTGRYADAISDWGTSVSLKPEYKEELEARIKLAADLLIKK